MRVKLVCKIGKNNFIKFWFCRIVLGVLLYLCNMEIKIGLGVWWCRLLIGIWGGWWLEINIYLGIGSFCLCSWWIILKFINVLRLCLKNIKGYFVIRGCNFWINGDKRLFYLVIRVFLIWVFFFGSCIV